MEQGEWNVREGGEQVLILLLMEYGHGALRRRKDCIGRKWS